MNTILFCMLVPHTLHVFNLLVCDAILAQEYIVHTFFSLPPHPSVYLSRLSGSQPGLVPVVDSGCKHVVALWTLFIEFSFLSFARKGVLVDRRNFDQFEASILNITPVRYMLSPFDNKAWTRKTTAHTLCIYIYIIIPCSKG